MTVAELKTRILLLAVTAALIYSCGEKSSQTSQKHVFREDIADDYLEDSLLVQDQFSLELNVGDETERGTWQNPELVIRKIGDLKNKVVADIGSGTGYFTLPISRNAKKVLAIDIEQRYLDYIEDRKLELPIEQADVIETRLTVEDEPNLHSDEVDAVLLVNVFYYLEDRTNYMTIVNNALKDNGILVLVDFKPGDLPVGPTDNKVPTEQVVEILKVSGFKDIEVDEESLQYQYIVTAK
jgi:SAM-dependent methyltransferase